MKIKKNINPKILLIGNESDVNIKLLIDWLYKLNADFYFLNASIGVLDIIDYSFQEKKFLLSINDSKRIVTLDLSEIKVTFVRGHKLRFKSLKNPLNNDSINGFRDYEFVYKANLDSFLEHYLRNNTKFIGTWESGLINKLIVLEEAKKIGFKIPESHLKTNFHDFPEEEYISKSFGLSFHGATETNFYAAYTGRIDRNNVPESFMPTLVQQEVKKLYEIRSFVFLDEIYSMAIFSQMNKKSEVDYRLYDDENPYLNEPLKLPKELEKKVFRLMRNLKLNTGSVDFIYSEDGEYYFLEINPNGQFGFLGFVNGYDLYEKISKKILTYV